MSYDSRFSHYVSNIATADGELRLSSIMEATEYCIECQRYDDAALLVILAARFFSAPRSRDRLLGALSERELLHRLTGIPIFAAWLNQTGANHERGPSIAYDDIEAGWIDSEPFGKEGLLSACRELFGDLAPNGEDASSFGGLNLIYRLNNSRTRGEGARIYNPAAFGIRYVYPSAQDERHTILGRVSLGELSIRSVRLGTEPPDAQED